MKGDRSRLADRLLGGGQEPDPRFSLANERTFLAWIRTSLALLAGAVAVDAFIGPALTGSSRTFLALLLACLGLLTAGAAGLRCLAWSAHCAMAGPCRCRCWCRCWH